MHSDFPRHADETFVRYLTSGPHRPNLLVHGQVANGLLSTLRSTCSEPLHAIRLPGPLHVPEMRTGTLFLENPSGLTLVQQIAFHDWLNAGRAGVQVITIAPEPLWPLVEEGRFLEGLFYRLNVVSLDASEPHR